MNKILTTSADSFISTRLTEIFDGRGYKIKTLFLYDLFNNWVWFGVIGNKKKMKCRLAKHVLHIMVIV